MKVSSVNKKEHLKNLRFDASFHLSEGIQSRVQVCKTPYPCKRIGDVAERIFHAGRWKRSYVSSLQHGIALVGSSDMLKSDLSKIKLISRKYTPDIEDKKLKKGWILISCSGTIGNTVFTTKQHAEKLASQDVIRLVPNNILRPGYIYAYLSSKYGYSMLTQGTFGAVIQHIEPENVEVIPIPDFPEAFQKEVDDLIQESSTLREKAMDALEAAKQRIIDYTHSFDKSQGYKTSKVPASAIRRSFNCRLDPTYFINDGIDWIKGLNRQTKRLGDCNIKTWYPGIFKRSYVKDGYPYIKGSSLFLNNPFRSCEHLSKTRTPNVEELRLTEGLILISCAGVCGEVKLITKEYEEKEAIGSPDIIRLVSNDNLFTTEYLFAYLQIPSIKEYMQSLKYGSVIERFDTYNLVNLPVVVPTTELSQQITNIVHQYMDYTYRAFKAEDKAISMVEQEIEKWNKQ